MKVLSVQVFLSFQKACRNLQKAFKKLERLPTEPIVNPADSVEICASRQFVRWTASGNTKSEEIDRVGSKIIPVHLRTPLLFLFGFMHLSLNEPHCFCAQLSERA